MTDREGDAKAAAKSDETSKADQKPVVALPPAKKIFKVLTPKPKAGAAAATTAAASSAAEGASVSAASTPVQPAAPPKGDLARSGELLGQPTPAFSVLTSRCFPLSLRPDVLGTVLEGSLLTQLPVGDLLLRQDVVAQCPEAAKGYRGFWPHLRGHTAYCSFRNPRQNPSVHGGDAICSVETSGGRKKVGPKELLQLQKVMRLDIVASPAEEVPLDSSGNRRMTRAVTRAADWLKEMLEAKAQDPTLSSFDWHVLAGVQGSGDVKLRQKACAAASALPVAGFWVGGLGYSEDLASRARVLEAVSSSLPEELPRFLPLNAGSPVEVLQAVLLGIDMIEAPYPTQAANAGIALTFSWEMPKEELDALGGEDSAVVCEALVALLSPKATAPSASAPAQDASAQGKQGKQGKAKSDPSPAATGPALPMVTSVNLKDKECREAFVPIAENSPVKQYSRAYLYHLLEVRELLATMLLVQHNLTVYKTFFEAVRMHIEQGSIRRFAAWFMRTQVGEPSVDPATGPPPKKRRF